MKTVFINKVIIITFLMMAFSCKENMLVDDSNEMNNFQESMITNQHGDNSRDRDLISDEDKRKSYLQFKTFSELILECNPELRSSDLHTVAHEAAHTIQQRASLSINDLNKLEAGLKLEIRIALNSNEYDKETKDCILRAYKSVWVRGYDHKKRSSVSDSNRTKYTFKKGAGLLKKGSGVRNVKL